MASTPKIWTWMALGLVGTGVGLAGGCDAGEQLPSKPSVDNPPNTTSVPGKCTDGATQDCHVTIGKEAGILTCLVGTQACNGGVWGPCEGTISSEPAPPPPPPADPDAQQTLSLTDAGACINDPCDPTCKVFNEVPDGGIKPALGTGTSFVGGSITSIPGGFIGKGIKEPCGEALDCQFDEYCSAPTSGSCSHSKCATGAALTSGCDSCVTKICAASPSCCTTAASGTCSHSECTTGAALTNGCNSCVSQVCAQDATCCETTSGTCSHSKCSTGAALTTGCDSCVTSICAANPSCCTPSFNAACSSGQGHDPCVTGKKLTSGCDPCVTAICAANPSCCSGSGNAWTAACVAAVATTPACGGKTCSPTWGNSCVSAVASTCGQSCSPSWSAACVTKAQNTCGLSCSPTWDASCVSKVSSVCGAFCDGGSTPGDCKQWAPGATDASCASADLTIGVPCTGTVPVCNRGKAAAPAGVKVYVYPGNSSHFPLCAPPAGAETAQCTLTQPIPPGECVQLTDANCVGNNSLNGNKTLMVNPTAAVAECHCENNWSDYHNGGCQTSTSAGYPSVTYKQLYTASCPAGKAVHWSYLSYDSTTPGNSNIKFEAHTGDSASTLSSTLTLLATAKSTPAPSTQVCPFTGVTGCPISLYSALGPGNASMAALKLVITLNPTSDKASAPTLNSWKVTYSCPDSE